jgi:AhpC/TSA family protein/cytochrome c biogenesis DsbD-like protein
VELQSRAPELQKRGLAVAVISYDSRAVLADFATRHGITYPLLSDADSATIKRYGVLNTVVEEALGPNGKDPAVRADVQRYVSVTPPAERFRGMAFPGTFMLDRQGRVTSRFFEDYYWERNSVSNILLRLGTNGTAVQATQASTEHLDLRAYPSDASVAFGTRFSLVVDITPKPNMHLYAPGATGYRVVSLNITPPPPIRILPLRYPPSEIYHFVPLNEQVPVYQKPFKLVVEAVLEATAEARKALSGTKELVVPGTLEYQACDDKICYNPVSFPLSWTLSIGETVPGAPQPVQR